MKRLLGLFILSSAVLASYASANSTAAGSYKYTIDDQLNDDGSIFEWEDLIVSRPSSLTGSEGPEKLVIMDRNLGAYTNNPEDSKSEGYYYQWGNNYGFKNTCNDITCTGKVFNSITQSPASYNSNYEHNGYKGTSYFTGSNDYWENGEHHDNLWGGEYDYSGNNWGLDILPQSVTLRQGPCPDGYHVPSYGELRALTKYWSINNNGTIQPNTYQLYSGEKKFLEDFKIYFPPTQSLITTDSYLRSSSVQQILQEYNPTNAVIFNLAKNVGGNTYWVQPSTSATRQSIGNIRCFKNTYNYCEDPQMVNTCYFNKQNCPTECLNTNCNDSFVQRICAKGDIYCPFNCLNNRNGSNMKNLNVSYSTSGDKITLTWTPDTKSKHIIIYIYNDESEYYEKLATVPMESGKFEYNFKRNGTYNFQLQPRNYNGKSKFIKVTAYYSCLDPNIINICYNDFKSGNCPIECEDDYGEIKYEEYDSLNFEYTNKGNIVTVTWKANTKSKIIHFDISYGHGITHDLGDVPMGNESFKFAVPGDGIYSVSMVPNGSRYNRKGPFKNIKVNGVCDDEDVIQYCNINSNYCPKNCSSMTSHICGNGMVEEGEECDLGTENNKNEFCNNQCQWVSNIRMGKICGDGTQEGDEDCDSGSGNGNDGECSNICKFETTHECGDGKVDINEECDDGTNNGTTNCSTSCELDYKIEQACGNGQVESGEECDNGNKNGNDHKCSITCKNETNAPQCGNGIKETGETCTTCPEDLGHLCDPICGNGKAETGETCDNCPQDLGSKCSIVCGNGIKEAGEECDNGTGNGIDGICTSACKSVTTGGGSSSSSTGSTTGSTTGSSTTIKNRKITNNVAHINTPYGDIIGILITNILKNNKTGLEFHYSAGKYYSGSNSSSSSSSSSSTSSSTSTANGKVTDFSWYQEGNQSEYLSNGHTREKNNAYEFAYKFGLTTKMTIREADMDGYLTRIAMAKMLSYYAINVLGLRPDTSKDCTFDDLTSKLDKEFDNGGTLACQLGIMGVNTTKFKPTDYVTRAQLVSAISRMKYGTEDSHGTDYYSEHMKVLKDKGIITDTTPDKREKRGNLMLMLMRSELENK